MVKVIYIAGCSRSGSTITDAVLGSASGVISVGELAYLPQAGWIKGEYCACGETANDCPHWSSVQAAWRRKIDATTEDLVSVQRKLERFRYIHRPFLGIGSRHLNSYIEQVGALFNAITEASGIDVVVDASKNPLRARALARIPTIDLRVIHLVRDARGVAWSMMKQFKKNVEAGVTHDIRARSPSRSALSWARTNVVTEMALRPIEKSKRVLVRYEDFVSDPGTSLRSIAAATDHDFGDVIARLENEEAIGFGHTVAGNRVRMNREVRLRPDLEWRESMDERLQKHLWRLVRPLMSRYNYAQ